MPDSKDALLKKVLGFAATDGIADRSLREIAAGVGTSHRMLLYHFGSREGLLAAIVGEIEAQQRAAMTALASQNGETAADLMGQLWQQVSSPELRPFVRLFFEVFALAVRGAPGTERLLEGLTATWVEDAVRAAETLDVPADPALMRLGVAVTRGLLLDLLAGTPREEVDAAYEMFRQTYSRPTADSENPAVDKVVNEGRLR
jgi:AcrR family transcriptional regulator